MEQQNAPVNIEEQRKQERQNRRLEWKLRDAHDPDSIFIMPVGGDMGYQLINNLTRLERKLNDLKRLAAFTVEYKTVMETIGRIDNIVNRLWKHIKTSIPNLHSFKYEKWREMNDSKEKKLILANRKSSMWLLPRDEKMGQLAMGIKVLYDKIFELQALSGFEDIAKHAEFLKAVDSDMMEITEALRSLVPDRKKKGRSSNLPPNRTAEVIQ